MLRKYLGGVKRAILGRAHVSVPSPRTSTGSDTVPPTPFSSQSKIAMNTVGKAFSIREALQGALRDWIASSGISCMHTESLARDIAAILTHYREEDVPLFPQVYMFMTREHLQYLAPAASAHKVGNMQYGASDASTLLKDAAGIAIEGWSIYVLKLNESTFEYGVFRSQQHSYSVPAEESMIDVGANIPVIAIRNRGHLLVELVNTSKQACTISLTTETASTSPLLAHINGYVSTVTSDISEERVDDFKAYLSRLLCNLLQHSHGTLIATISTSAASKKADKAVWLDPPVELYLLYRNAVDQSTADSLASLQAAEALLKGMINSDGVVVFSASGTIVAFRLFLSPTSAERSQIPEGGGGRRRTFGLMALRVKNKDLQGAFFRSQDGMTAFEGPSNG